MRYIVNRIHPHVKGKKHSLKIPNNNPALLKVCTKSRKEDYSAKQKAPCGSFLFFGQRVSILIPFPMNVCYR